MKRYRTLLVAFRILRVHALLSVQTPTGDGALKPLTQFDTAFYVQSLLELHRQVCPVDKYSNLVVLRLSDEALLQTILPQIISDQTYKKTVSDRAELFHTYANDFYSCNFIPIDSLVHLNISAPLANTTRSIFFYPRWILKEIQHPSDVSFLISLRKGYAVRYDYGNTMEIQHWNFLSNQTLTIDPLAIAVPPPGELRDLHGYEIVLASPPFTRPAMVFDVYFLQQIVSRKNATLAIEDKITPRTTIVVVFSPKEYITPYYLPAFGRNFMAVQVPRAKPKPIFSILIDPFDRYTWYAFFLLILAMAITLSLFGAQLGTHHLVEIVLELIMMSLAGPSRAYGGAFENRLITMFSLMGIVLISSYQSLVISYMSLIRYYPEINTYEDIQKKCLFENNAIVRDFEVRKYEPGHFPGYDRVCYLEHGRDNEHVSMSMFAVLANHSDDWIRFRMENYRYAGRKFYEYIQCYFVFPPNLRDLFQFYLQAIFESGIYDYFYNNKIRPKWHFERETFIKRTINLGDLTVLWYAYGFGTILSVLCYVAEITYFKLSQYKVVKK
uniref:Ionotropic glutamate receptor C-terminal domain-containing protein n=1 Tax=Anopheles coluzzii TaxID=1518534 RepID=A0A6E8WC81_ANOCL